jgi:hypothetical protein
MHAPRHTPEQIAIGEAIDRINAEITRLEGIARGIPAAAGFVARVYIRRAVDDLRAATTRLARAYDSLPPESV